MAAHHALGASGAHRWIACPGSVQLVADLNLPDESSEAAEEGTLAHSLAEFCLVEGFDAETAAKTPKLWRPDELAHWDVPEDMPDFVQAYVDFVLGELAEGGGELFVEARLDLGRVTPGNFGTGDAVIVRPSELVVIDLKYGRGVRVGAQGNPQPRLYAVGAYDTFGFLVDSTAPAVRSIIHQPRLDHISEEGLSFSELEAFLETAQAAASAALGPDAPFGPSEHACRWCPAAKVCKARAEHALNVAAADFDDPAPKPSDPRQLDAKTVARILPYVPELVAWAKDLEGHALGLMLEGETVDGYKLVRANTKRRYRDAAATVEAYKQHEKAAELVETVEKPVAITKAEKLLGKRSPIVAELVEKPEGAPTLAPISDKRPEYNGAQQAARDFSE